MVISKNLIEEQSNNHKKLLMIQFMELRKKMTVWFEWWAVNFVDDNYNQNLWK